MADIRLEKVGYSYENQGQKYTALEQIEVQIHDGEFVCILGSSGCGKTTLLRLLAGLQMPGQGQILLDGKRITGPGTDRAMVFQNYPLFPWMKAEKNVRFGIRQADRTCKKEEAARKALKYLEMVGMAEAADKYPYQLSGGMKQRVAIARALAMDADTLLLDEPFGALDAGNRRELQELLLKLWSTGEKKKTVVFVTHDIGEAILLADRILYMTPGKIAAEISVKQPRPRDLRSREMQNIQKMLLEMFEQSGEKTESCEQKEGTENETGL